MKKKNLLDLWGQWLRTKAFQRNRFYKAPNWFQARGLQLPEGGTSRPLSGSSGNVPQWATILPQNIIKVSSRLKHSNDRIVQIENQPAVKLIKRYARENVFIYADPPYVLSTRSKRIYACEMKDADHIELLQLLLKHPGPVMISGYMNEIYADILSDWETRIRLANCEGGLKREEVIWMNYEPAVEQINLFCRT